MPKRVSDCEVMEFLSITMAAKKTANRKIAEAKRRLCDAINAGTLTPESEDLLATLKDGLGFEFKPSPRRKRRKEPQEGEMPTAEGFTVVDRENEHQLESSS